LEEVLPRSHFGPHPQSEQNDEGANRAYCNKCRPVLFAVEILGFAFPRGVRNYRCD
jgi:hypothetical protein